MAISFDDATLKRLGKAFTFGSERTNEQDAEFGLIVLSETASKALSPGINDTGTAIEALLILKALLWNFAQEEEDDERPCAPNVIASFAGPSDFVEAALAPIARDGAGSIEVGMRLRQSLSALSASENAELAAAARDLAEQAIAYATEAGMPERDLARLQAISLAHPE